MSERLTARAADCGRRRISETGGVGRAPWTSPGAHLRRPESAAYLGRVTVKLSDFGIGVGVHPPVGSSRFRMAGTPA
jgi:hypothetical protein